MSVDLFQTRFMMRALEQMKPPKNFLRDTFFTEEVKSESKTVEIDVFKGKRRMAPFVAPHVEGKMVQKLGYTTNIFEPPYIKEKCITAAVELMNRSIGENMYVQKTPAQRAAEKLGKELMELNEMIDRREEWMCSQALTTGKIVVSGDGLSYTVDFYMPADHLITLTGNDLWSDTTNSDPLGDLKTRKRKIGQDAGMVPDTVIMGVDAWDAFSVHPKIVSALDTRRIDLGQIVPTALPNGVTFMGTIREIQCDIYTYDEWYIDDNGTEQWMIPTKKVTMLSTRARMTRNYGAIQDLKAIVPVSRFPKSWEKEDPSARFVMLQSAPLMALNQPDAVITATVLS